MPYKNSETPKPSEELEALMMGRVEWRDAQPAIRSWASFYIFHAAKQILAAPDKGTRRKMLGKIPARIRPLVEKEVIRQWEKKKND